MSRKSAARNWFALIVVTFLAAPAPASAAERTALAAAASSISKDQLKEHVDVLSDDTFEGRETGSRGGRAAGNYLIKAFESYGLAPAGEGGTYVQPFGSSSRNILGLIEGSDPHLKQQVLVIGAHYDHVGYGRPTNSFGPLGYIHNGADDNASGVAAVLEIIEAMGQLSQPPKRTVLFACWDGEEQGLLGSRHWVARPTIPLAHVGLAINIDMLGRMKNARLEVLGVRTAAGLRRLVSESNVEGLASIEFPWTLKPDSDHWPFYEKRIPILMFHTGLHEDYHRPSDDAHRVNHDGLACATKLVFHTVMQWAEASHIPGFRAASKQESAHSSSSLEQPIPPQPPRFGIPFQIEEADPPAIIVTAVTPGSPAEKAGLQAGDRLLKFQGQTIHDEQRLRLELLAARGETTFLVQRPGNKVPILVKVVPAGDPIRVGVSWRTDAGEPGTVILTQVIYGSAAHVADLAVGDRIYEVAGRPFKTQDEFAALISSAVSPLQLLVERDGRLRQATLHLLDETQPAE